MSDHPKIGDIWHRVDGSYIDDGSEQYVGMELCWTQWEAVRVTPQGAWFRCVTFPYRKHRFALASGARWLRRSKIEALSSLISRKRRQIAIVEHQKIAASETLELANAAFFAMKGSAS